MFDYICSVGLLSENAKTHAMAKKNKSLRNAKNYMLPHSEAKVEMYSKYLEKYIKILGRTPPYIKKINIIDVFCGVGVYENGKLGSPIKAYDILLKDIKILESEGRPVKDIHLIINDLDKSNVKNVKDYIRENFLEHDKLKLSSGSRDVSSLFPNIISWLEKEKDAKTLLFIDPYGYKEINSNVLRSLMKNGNTEIVLFLPISHMRRFSEVAQKDDENKSYEKLRSFINQFFSEDHPVRQQKLPKIHDYIRYLKEALSFDDDYFTTSYFIQRDKTNYYALFFMTSNSYGLEKILETKWELDKLEGRGFLLNQPLPLEINNLKEPLKQFMLNNLRTNIDLYIFVLKQEYLPKHAGKILREWNRAGKLVDENGLQIKSRSSIYYIKNYKEVKLKLKLIE